MQLDGKSRGCQKQAFSHVLSGESIKAAGKGRSNHRARNKRGSRARASKDTSKLLLLYDENILERDPLREQKDLAFAQAYLTRVGKCCFLLLLFCLNEATSIREVFLKCSRAVAGVAQWIEHWLANQQVAGSIPSQGTYLGCGPGPHHTSVFLSLSLSPSLKSLPLLCVREPQGDRIQSHKQVYY